MLSDLLAFIVFCEIPIVSSFSVLGRVKTEFLLHRDAYGGEFVFICFLLVYIYYH